mgnify:FL=1
MEDDFWQMVGHIRDVAREGISHGDKSRALLNMHRYSRLAREAKNETERETFRAAAKMFAHDLTEAPSTIAARVASMPAGRTPPTPETAIKLRRPRDPLANIRLNSDQAMAAIEIRAIYEALTRGLQSRGLNLSPIRVDTSVRSPEPWEGMSDRLQERMWSVFKPWSTKLRRVRVVKDVPISARDVAYSVLVHLVPLWALDRSLGVSKSGESGKALKKSLSLYSEIGRKRT